MFPYIGFLAYGNRKPPREVVTPLGVGITGQWISVVCEEKSDPLEMYDFSCAHHMQ